MTGHLWKEPRGLVIFVSWSGVFSVLSHAASLMDFNTDSAVEALVNDSCEREGQDSHPLFLTVNPLINFNIKCKILLLTYTE